MPTSVAAAGPRRTSNASTFVPPPPVVAAQPSAPEPAAATPAPAPAPVAAQPQQSAVDLEKLSRLEARLNARKSVKKAPAAAGPPQRCEARRESEG